MQVAGRPKLQQFAKKHALYTKRLYTWLDTVKTAMWHHDTDVKQTYSSADYIPPERETGYRYIFNVGNAVRITTDIDFHEQIVYIRDVQMHTEYDLQRKRKGGN